MKSVIADSREKVWIPVAIGELDRALGKVIIAVVSIMYDAGRLEWSEVKIKILGNQGVHDCLFRSFTVKDQTNFIAGCDGNPEVKFRGTGVEFVWVVTSGPQFR